MVESHLSCFLKSKKEIWGNCWKEINSSTSKGEYLKRYVEGLGCQTIIKENTYVDKDYITDYARFYSRSFKTYPRFTQRLA